MAIQSRRRLHSDLVNNDDPAPRALKVRRLKTYETNKLGSMNLLVNAQASGLLDPSSVWQTPRDQSLLLSKAELDTIKDDLLDVRCDAQHVTVVRSTISDPSRAHQMLCSKIRDPAWKSALSSYLDSPHFDRPGGASFADLWTNFADLETSVSQRPREALVAPSGEFEKPMRLLVQWHFPTNNCRRPDFAHSADTSNVCTNMLLEAGLNPLLYSIGWTERWFRRENTIGESGSRDRVPMAKRSEIEREIHDAFNRDVIDLANPKVMLLLGEPASNWFLKEFKPLEAILSQKPRLRVWIVAQEYADVRTGKSYKFIDKIAVPCLHPEAVFSGDEGRGQALDASIRLAVELSGLCIPLNGSYFHDLEVGRTKLRRFAFKSGPNVNKAIVLNSMLAFENESEDKEKVPFDEIPHGILQLFTKWTGKTATRPVMESHLFSLCPRSHVSITKGMHVMLVQKSLDNQKAQGYPNLAKARAKLLELTQAGLDPRKPENKAKVKEIKARAKAIDDGDRQLVPAVGTGRVYSQHA